MASVTGIYADRWPEPMGEREAREAAAGEIEALARRAVELSVKVYNDALPSYVARWEETGAPIPRRALSFSGRGAEIEDACGRAVARSEAAGAPADAVEAVKRFCDELLSGALESDQDVANAVSRAASSARRPGAGQEAGGYER